MDFHVDLTDQAKRDIADIHNWLRSQHAGDAAERWFVALGAAIASLKQFPSRCPLAPENEDSPVELRRMLYGRKPHVYRIFFTVETDTVHVLHIRHARRRPLRGGQ
jgi:plasmid stabilization system protein ParE